MGPGYPSWVLDILWHTPSLVVCQTGRSNQNSRIGSEVSNSWENILDEPPDLESNCVTDSVSQEKATLDGGPKSSKEVSVVSTDNAETTTDCVGALDSTNTDGLLTEDFRNTQKCGECYYPYPPI